MRYRIRNALGIVLEALFVTIVNIVIPAVLLGQVSAVALGSPFLA